VGDGAPRVVPQFEAIFEVLNRWKVRYVVIGGVAAILQGVPLPRTLDLDVTPAADSKNQKRLMDALREMEARLRAPGLEEPLEIELDHRTLSKMTTMTFMTRFGPLDVCLRPDGTGGYEDLVRDAEIADIEGLSVPLMSLDDIERSKHAAGREKDAEHLEILMEHRRGAFGRDRREPL
jgi:hypothetical protein